MVGYRSEHVQKIFSGDLNRAFLFFRLVGLRGKWLNISMTASMHFSQTLESLAVAL
jgi:hypothetical protein